MLKIKRHRQWTMPHLVRRVVVAWLFGVTIAYQCLPAEYRTLTGLSPLRNCSPWILCMSATAMLAVLSLLTFWRVTVNLERWCLTGIFLVLGTACLVSSFTWPFFFACLLIFGILLCFCILGWDKSNDIPRLGKAGHISGTLAVAALALLVFSVMSAWTVGRLMTFNAPTYDFGIFSQMFYNMKTTGIPVTTLERPVTLSHFRVHVSPVYYLLLPFYWIVPHPASLQVLQAAVLVSAVIPMWKLCCLYGLSDVQRVLMCIVLLLFPAFSGGVGYDIHENCFLTPLILWLLYGVDRKNTPLTLAAAILALCVKEDAAVYVAVAALYLLVKTLIRRQQNIRWNLIVGGTLLGVSMVWFFLVCGFLAGSGDGVMTYRYENFMYSGKDSLVTVIFAVLRNPMKLIYECVDPEKLSYIALTLLPLLGLPLLTRRYERYILLIPYLLINLMSDYPYQHNIFFQYSFGSLAFLMYLTVVNLADLRTIWLRVAALVVAAAACAGCFGGVILPEAVMYPAESIRYYDEYQRQRELLDTIPEEASVSAGTYYTAYLSQREIIYDIGYASREQILSTEYVVVSAKTAGDYDAYGAGEGFENWLLAHGYQVTNAIPGELTIYHRSQ